jgi:hypothetical protein
MLLVHLGIMPLLLLQAILVFRPAFLFGFWDSLILLPAILSRRFRERRLRVVGDRQIRNRFNHFRKEPSVQLK